MLPMAWQWLMSNISSNTQGEKEEFPAFLSQVQEHFSLELVDTNIQQSNFYNVKLFDQTCSYIPGENAVALNSS